jgi:hypothetical protein
MYTKLLLIYISQLQYMLEMPTFVLYTEQYTPFKVAANRFYNTLEFNQYGPEKWFIGGHHHYELSYSALP